MPVDTQQFKDVLAQFASGVTVVTTLHEDQPIGLTVSSFASVSLDPPLVLICLSKTMFSHQVVAETGSFAVSILAADQVELGKRFAGMIPEITDRFAGVTTQTAQTGCPILSGCLAWLDCRVWQIHEAGDHSVFLGEVVEAGVDASGEPLMYYDRQWRA